jgi:hypothetical protein
MNSDQIKAVAASYWRYVITVNNSNDTRRRTAYYEEY